MRLGALFRRRLKPFWRSLFGIRFSRHLVASASNQASADMINMTSMAGAAELREAVWP
jgi:hypothetical protein